MKSYLVPDKSNLGKRKTSVKKKTLSPTFNEILRVRIRSRRFISPTREPKPAERFLCSQYRVNMEYLRTQTLILSVWHNDTFGRNSFLGEVELDMSKWDFDHTRMNYFPLKSRVEARSRLHKDVSFNIPFKDLTSVLERTKSDGDLWSRTNKSGRTLPPADQPRRRFVL